MTEWLPAALQPRGPAPPQGGHRLQHRGAHTQRVGNSRYFKWGM